MRSRPPWRMDDALAHEVAAAAGTSLEASVDELGVALHRWIPSGSTAKREAIAAGVLPPGLDPVGVAEQILGGSTHSWTCWPAATVTAAVLAAAGHDAEVVAELRTDPAAPPVDVHAAVVVDGRHLVDPCLGPGSTLALEGDTCAGPSASAEIVPLDQHRWEHVTRTAGRDVNRYVTLSRSLDPREVRAFLEVSVTHSGVPTDRRYLRRPLPDGVLTVADHERGGRLRRWRREGEGWSLVVECHGPFDDLLAASSRVECPSAAAARPTTDDGDGDGDGETA